MNRIMRLKRKYHQMNKKHKGLNEQLTIMI